MFKYRNIGIFIDLSQTSDDKFVFTIILFLFSTCSKLLSFIPLFSISSISLIGSNKDLILTIYICYLKLYLCMNQS